MHANRGERLQPPSSIWSKLVRASKICCWCKSASSADSHDADSQLFHHGDFSDLPRKLKKGKDHGESFFDGHPNSLLLFGFLIRNVFLKDSCGNLPWLSELLADCTGAAGLRFPLPGVFGGILVARTSVFMLFSSGCFCAGYAIALLHFRLLQHVSVPPPAL